MVSIPSVSEGDKLNLQWMHNGEISEFTKIKRALQQSLPEELFLYPSGYTGKLRLGHTVRYEDDMLTNEIPNGHSWFSYPWYILP
jgi:predicted glutamine amidotransferase